MGYLIVIGLLVVVWAVASMKTSRGDGIYQARLHPYRRLMQFIMPTRTESVVYFDVYADAENLLRYLEEAGEAFDANVTHCIVAAAAVGLFETPKMNTFVSGRRLYDRKGVFLTFSVKRQKGKHAAKLSAVKMEMPEEMTFKELCTAINGKINVERSGKKTYADKEFALFNILPRPILVGATKLVRLLDYYNLLPYNAFIKNDGMYTSMFIANMGSVGMGPGYHHLYEWGNCPIFMMVGQIEEKPVVRDGQVVIRPIIHFRWSYDERIDDGIGARLGFSTVNRVLENPYQELGCLAEDGSDARKLGSTKGAKP